MNLTHELRVHRRTHRLNQDELAHLVGITPTMIMRMEKGAKPQLADIQAMLGLEFVFGKPLSQIFSALYALVEEAVMGRATELEPIWQSIDDSTKARANLALLASMMERVPAITDAA